MVVYGLTQVPLVELVRRGVPDLVHAWYADDACLAGKIHSIGPAVDLILKHGPARGLLKIRTKRKKGGTQSKYPGSLLIDENSRVSHVNRRITGIMYTRGP